MLAIFGNLVVGVVNDRVIHAGGMVSGFPGRVDLAVHVDGAGDFDSCGQLYAGHSVVRGHIARLSPRNAGHPLPEDSAGSVR